MNLLLDTHALLWFVAGDSRLSATAREAIEAVDTINHVSLASWWEIAIKCSLGKIVLEDSLEDFMAARLDEGFRMLAIEPRHLHGLVDLPFHHRDPFDRLIISQAREEGFPICTVDPAFRDYGVETVW